MPTGQALQLTGSSHQRFANVAGENFRTSVAPFTDLDAPSVLQLLDQQESPRTVHLTAGNVAKVNVARQEKGGVLAMVAPSSLEARGVG